MLKIAVVGVPFASQMAKESRERALQSAEQEERKRAERLAEGWESVPDLIAEISRRIMEAANKGEHEIDFSFVDTRPCCYGTKNDSRTPYTFKGTFNYEMAEEITKIFRAFGYHGFAEAVCRMNHSCYRDGHVKFWFY